MPKKNDFIGYTAEEIMASEAVNYIIQIDKNLFKIRGRWLFSKKSAYVYYSKIVRELLYQIGNGSEIQKFRAEKDLSALKIMPFRVH